MKLVINNKSVDLAPKTTLDYTRTSSIFSALKGDYTLPFELPGTAKNLALFGNPHLPQSGVDVQKEFPGELWLGSFLISTGIIRLRKTLRSNSIVTIIVNMEFSPAGLSKTIWSKKLNTFDLGSETIPTISVQSTHFFKELWANIDITYATNFIFVFAEIKAGNDVIASTPAFIWANGYTTDDSGLKNAISRFLNEIVSDELTITANTDSINVKTETSRNDIKIAIRYGNSAIGAFNEAAFNLPPINYNTINQTYYNSKINNSIYCLPEIRNTAYYVESNKKWNGIINAKDGSTVLLNSDGFQSKYSVVPHLKLTWLFGKLAELMGLTFTGSFIASADIQKIIIHNLFGTDKQAAETTIPFNVHDSVISYSNHLPGIPLGEFFQSLCDQFGIGIEFNLLTNTAEFFFFDEILNSTTYLDLSGKIEANYESETLDIKQQQLVWSVENSDELAKDTLEQFSPKPTNAEVEADTLNSYDQIKCLFPSLIVNTVNSVRQIPEIRQQGISSVFSQSKNTNPKRFLFWDGQKADSQTANLSLNFYGANGLDEKMLKKKRQVINTNKPYKINALLTLQQLMQFSFKTKIFADGIWYLADEINVKITQEQTIFNVTFSLRRLLY